MKPIQEPVPAYYGDVFELLPDNLNAPLLVKIGAIGIRIFLPTNMFIYFGNVKFKSVDTTSLSKVVLLCSSVVENLLMQYLPRCLEKVIGKF